MDTCTIREYIQSNSDLDSKIAAIDRLIDAMILNTIDTIEDSGTMAFTMDDGQMKVSTQFRSASDISNGIASLEKIKHMYVNRRNGHRTVLRGGLNC